tara:strand:+ start:2819 stop:3064 length:246 start_codon:yes stop_codon:yes gene_type:complete
MSDSKESKELPKTHSGHMQDFSSAFKYDEHMAVSVSSPVKKSKKPKDLDTKVKEDNKETPTSSRSSSSDSKDDDDDPFFFA